MKTMSDSREKRDEALRPQLRKAEDQLQDSLDEVCEEPPPGELNTGELIRVEETLAIAAAAAKEAVTLRRKMGTNDKAQTPPPAPPSPAPPSPPNATESKQSR